MDIFDFFKDAYYKELDLKNNINNSISFPVAINSIFIGAFFYFLINFKYSCHFFLLISLIVFSIHYCISTLLSIYHIIRSYLNTFSKGYNYEYLPRSELIYNFYNRLKSFYQDNDFEKVEKDCEGWLISAFASATNTNRDCNSMKIHHIYMAKKFLLYSFIFLVFILIIFIINYFKHT